MSTRKPYYRVRSQGDRDRRQERFEQKQLAKAIAASIAHTRTLIVRCTLPSELYRVPRDGAVVSAYVKPYLHNGLLPLLPIFPGAKRDTENLRVLCFETKEDVEALGPGGIDITWVKWLPMHVLEWLQHQPLNRVYAARFVKQVPLSTEQLICVLWKKIQALKPYVKEKNANRSSTPALHLGIWQQYSDHPCIAHDGLQLVSNEREKEAVAELRTRIREFMNLLKRHIIPKVNDLLRREFPLMYKLTPVIQTYVQDRTPNLEPNSPFNLESSVTMVAVKDGSSERAHNDWNDPYPWPSVLAPLSENGFTGGRLSLPQLGGSLPVPRRAIALARTRALCHWSTPFTGDRLVLTFFLPASLARSALAQARVHDLL
ncbi:hypothetical protein C8F01DRAFT_1355555 [Mycena amicta]|nr:hypothetical protein C8F01DRAFT_1355555 [Mycena amicta]